MSPKQVKIHYIIGTLSIIFSLIVTSIGAVNNLVYFPIIGTFGFNFVHLTTILVGAFLGTIPAMIFVAAIFIINVIYDINYAYMVFVFFLAAIISTAVSRYHVFRSLKKTLIAALGLNLVLGNIWYLIVCAISTVGFSEVTPIGMLALFLVSLPECLVGMLIPYFSFRYLPDRVKIIFYNGFFYTKHYEEHIEGTYHDSYSPLGHVMAFQTTLNMTAVMVFTIALMNGLFMAMGRATFGSADPVVAFFGQLEVPQNEGLHLVTGDSLMSSDFTSFIIKVVMMDSTIIVPLIILSNFAVQSQIVNPIKNISHFMEEYVGTQDDKRRDFAEQLHDIGEQKFYYRRDEIGNLFGSLAYLIDDINNYIDRSKLQQAVESRLHIAEQANVAKNNFLSGISHEIRTPINTILGMDEMILRESDEDNIISYANDIKESGRILLSLINDTLDFSKIENGKMKINPVEYNLHDVMSDVYSEFKMSAQQKGLEFEYRINPDIPSILYGDDIRIKQILNNLLSNAIKYTDFGKVSVVLDFKRIGEEQIMLSFSVSDTGQGMRKEEIDLLYKPFERLNEDHNRTIQGTGLGMSIVKELLQLMDSEIHVQSRYGEGSLFFFDLTQKVIEWKRIGDLGDKLEEKESPKKAEKFSAGFIASQAKVLVVDDTEMNLKVFKALLKDTKMQIDTASSGFQAIEMVRDKKYDIIFLDYRMPEMDGVETLHRMRQMSDNKSADAPVITLTANAISGAREMFLKEGFENYITKPIKYDLLEHLFLEYLPGELIEISQEQKQEDEITDARLKRLPEGYDGIDLVTAIKGCYRESILIETMTTFYEQIDDTAREIQELEDMGDLKNYTIKVHALKNSARLIGALHLSQLSLELEKAGDSGKVGRIINDTPLLLELLFSYKEILREFGPSEDEEDEDKPEIPEKQYLEAMTNLKAMVEDFDFDGADSVLEMLADYKVPEQYMKSYTEIKKLVSAVDHDQLMNLFQNDF